jgi:uncharacterized protein
VVAPDRPCELDTVLLKVASRCNIDCKYCYVYHMGDNHWVRLEKFMSKETVDATAEALGELASQQKRLFSIVLHGGEPLLLGTDRLEYLLMQLRKHLSEEYPISLQTNGILISEAILDICAKYKTSVAVSLDGPQQVHDKERVTHNGEGTFAQVLAGIKTLQAHAEADFLYAGLLAVVDPTADPLTVYDFFKEVGTPSVDFLYRDGNHSKLPAGKSSEVSTEYGDWMVRLLHHYLNDPHPMPIRILDDMLKALLGGHVSKEGLGLSDFGILIVDTDGTLTKNDTLKSSYEGADRFEAKWNIRDGRLYERLQSEEFQAYRMLQRPTASECLACPLLNVCGGGMTLHRWKAGNGFDNPSIYCADQKYLIHRMQSVLAQFDLIHG